MRARFPGVTRLSAVEAPRLPDIPILAADNPPLSQHSIWQIGNRATPIRMSWTAHSSVDAASTRIGDPQREPTTGDSVVYSVFNVNGTRNRSIRLADWASPFGNVQLYADASGDPFGSLMPSWKPDGSKILFRAKGAGSALNLIKHMDPDGTGVTTLYTGGATVTDPQYNYDGTKIAWQESNTIKSANADGSSPATIFTPAGSDAVADAIAWQRNASVIGFNDGGSTFTGDLRWKVMNDDGSGVATWLTTSHAVGYGPGQTDGIANMYSWLEDGTHIVTTIRELAAPDPDWRVTLVYNGGHTYLTPAYYPEGGTRDANPVALTGMLEGVERLWWTVSPGVEVVSVLPDGSDYRVDWDGSGTAGGSFFHGFRGDTLNI